jgi:hypothetical protein
MKVDAVYPHCCIVGYPSRKDSYARMVPRQALQNDIEMISFLHYCLCITQDGEYAIGSGKSDVYIDSASSTLGITLLLQSFSG